VTSPTYTTTPAPTHVGPLTVSVIAPCLNEEGNIDALVKRTLATFDEMRTVAELVLVDDSSTDNTWSMIEAHAKKDERIRGVKHSQNGGITAAWKNGLEVCEGHLICLIDADLQNRPEDIPLLYKAYLREVPDMVQAVRHATGSIRNRQFLSRGLNRLLNVSFGMNLSDNKSGFILTRRDVMSAVLRRRYDYRYFQSFLGVSAGRHGYIIAEVDTNFEPRVAGKSFLPRFPIFVCARIVWELAKFRYETWRAGNSAVARTSDPFARPAILPNPAGGEAS